jgi:hypothetical protein
MLFSGTVVWLSVAETPVWILAGVTLISVLALLLMSMPRFRFWNRARPPARGAQHTGPAPAAVSPAPAAVSPPPAAAGSLATEARPAPRAG